MHDAHTLQGLRTKYETLHPIMDARMRRPWAATEAQALGWGGISALAAATGLSRNTIAVGITEIENRSSAGTPVAADQRVRRPGGGRKLLTETDPGLAQALEALVEPLTRGHPESPLRWTCKSTRKLAEELSRQGHPISDRTVARLLYEAG